MTLSGEGEPRKVQATVATSGLLPMLGVQPLLGQNFTASDDRQKRNVTLDTREVLADCISRRSCPWAVPSGWTGKVYTVLGVVPDGQRFRHGPISGCRFRSSMPSCRRPARFHPLEVLGRLKPGATVPQAQAEMDVFAKRLAVAYPATNGSLGGFVIPLSGQMTGQVRPALMIAWAAAALVLLIACANLAQLVLARTVDRSGEFETRAALGASRSQLIRPVLVENLVIAFAGAVVSVMLSFLAVPLIARFGGGRIPRLESAGYGVSLDPQLRTGRALRPAVRFPAFWNAIRLSHNESARAGARFTASRSRTRFGSALIAVEVALSFLVLTSAGLLLRSFAAIINEDPGSTPIALSPLRSSCRPVRLGKSTGVPLRKTTASPAAVAWRGAVASTNSVPMGLGPTERSRYATRFGVPGVATDPGHYPVAQLRWVSEDYFRVLGIPLEQGRYFDSADRGKERYILNRAFAERYYPNQNAAGKQLIMDVGTAKPSRADIVGVVGNVRDLGLDIPPQPTLYVVGSSPGLVVLLRVSERARPDFARFSKPFAPRILNWWWKAYAR